MKITCDSCGSHYKIADDKVRGRRVKVRCKSCGKTLVVDGATDGGAAAGQPEAGPVSAAIAGGGLAPDTWSVNLNETDQRTMTTNEIVDGYRAGWIVPEAYVWRDGMSDWTPLMEVAELRDAIGPTSQPKAIAAGVAFEPAAAAGQVAQAAGGGFSVPRAGASARIAGGRAQRGGDLFGGVEHAGGEDDARSALPMAGTQPYDDPKPTGARNENSVLFSLDALKVGFAGGGASAATSTAPSGPKPKAPPRRSAAASNPDDPFGMGSSGSMGAPASPLISFGGNDALLTAPPPPEPPKIVVADPVIGDAVLPPLQRKGRPNKVVLAGAALALLLVGGIVVANLGGEDEQAVAEATPPAGEDKAADKTAAASEKAAEEKKEEPKPEEKSEAKTEPEKTAEAQKKPGAEATKPKSAGAAAKPAAAKTEDAKPQVKQQVSDGVASFNKGAAVAALSSAASAASGCKRPGGPTGTGRAVVTFAPSGRVTSANVQGGSFGGTSVGGCIASVFRRATVPPFSGSPVTVSKSFNISP